MRHPLTAHRETVHPKPPYRRPGAHALADGGLAARLACVVAVALVAVAGCSSSSGTGTKPSKDQFCTLLVAFRASNDALSADVGSGDPAVTKTAVDRLVGQAQTLQQRAPKDIAPDVAKTVGFLTQLRSLLAKFSYDLTRLQADPAAVEQFGALNSADVISAA